jgi:hypothetical protein
VTPKGVTCIEFHAGPFVVDFQEALERIRDPAQFEHCTRFVLARILRYSVHDAAASLAAS